MMETYTASKLIERYVQPLFKVVEFDVRRAGLSEWVFSVLARNEPPGDADRVELCL